MIRMHRSRWLHIAVFVAVSAVSSRAQQNTSEGEAARQSDAYTIYSLIMTNPATSHGPSNDEVYLIADTTQPGYPVQPCVRVPKKYELAYGEILSDYNSRKDKPVKLERLLHIKKSYELLTPRQVQDFNQLHFNSSIPPVNGTDLLTRATDLFSLSNVYFNEGRTLALTAVSTYCGVLCGATKWKVFEKISDGHWEERPWVYCTTMSRNQTPDKTAMIDRAERTGEN